MALFPITVAGISKKRVYEKMKRLIIISFATLTIFGSVLAECPSSDLNGDCFIDLEDFAVISTLWLNGYDISNLTLMADQWSSTDPSLPDDFVYIPDHQFDMGDHHGDGGWPEKIHTVFVDAFFMSRYEITNRQYCDYLNWAYNANDIKVVGTGVQRDVYAVSDISESYPYYSTHATRIDFHDENGTFDVGTKGNPPRDMSNDPVVMVSWYGAAAYCNWLSIQTGKESCYNLSSWECNLAAHGYRLPTEAEWEHAGRGGNYSPYFRFAWGDTISHILANHYADSAAYTYDVNPPYPYFGFHPDWFGGEGGPYTSTIGSFSANGYGLFDMCGNVVEWCNDWYDGMYYYNSPYDNPSGPVNGTARICRGGAYDSSAPSCRISGRSYGNPNSRRINAGFRVLLNIN